MSNIPIGPPPVTRAGRDAGTDAGHVCGRHRRLRDGGIPTRRRGLTARVRRNGRAVGEGSPRSPLGESVGPGRRRNPQSYVEVLDGRHGAARFRCLSAAPVVERRRVVAFNRKKRGDLSLADPSSRTSAVSLSLPWTCATAVKPRSVVRGNLLAAGHPEALADTAELLVGELVSNALRHAESALRLNVLYDERGVRGSVSDGSRAMAVLRRAQDTWEGRSGLALVDCLCDRWGSYPARRGKVVWFRLTLEGCSRTLSMRGRAQASAALVAENSRPVEPPGDFRPGGERVGAHRSHEDQLSGERGSADHVPSHSTPSVYERASTNRLHLRTRSWLCRSRSPSRPAAPAIGHSRR
ncbi:ATP-binding protein [Streptomyces sp. NPDC052107]|uniref:ATP-binding protein n=1 Tax=Streptomyces sp. NPDC052107 TaxID=3155632 RepID=UPI00343AE733